MIGSNTQVEKISPRQEEVHFPVLTAENGAEYETISLRICQWNTVKPGAE
jgi:hypothetical protein